MSDNSSPYDTDSDFNENPTREALAMGMMSTLGPSVEFIRDMTVQVLKQQTLLGQHISDLSAELQSIMSKQVELTGTHTFAIEINEIQNRMTITISVLQSAQTRLDCIIKDIEVLRAIDPNAFRKK